MAPAKNATPAARRADVAKAIAEITPPALEFDSRWRPELLSQRYSAVAAALACPLEETGFFEAIDRWEQLRRDVSSWKSMVEIRTRQNAGDAMAYEQSAIVASSLPQFEAYDSKIKRAILDSPHRNALESRIGGFVLSRWALDLQASHPQMSQYLEEQSRLGDRYTQTLAAMAFVLEGRPRTQPELTSLQKHADRSVRRAALFAKLAAYDAHGAELDDIFDALVRCRTSMAAAIGEPSFTMLAYRRLGRLDYGPAEVRELRDEIRSEIVPLAMALASTQAKALGIDVLMPWDESVYTASSRLPTRLPMDRLLDALQDAYRSVHPALGKLASELRSRSLMDVTDRTAKAPGAFCEALPHLQMPFVFANATGAAADALTIAHETGHAFQFYRSRDQKIWELMIPTNETAEIHSIALEFLLWPHYERVVGEAAQELRHAHLRSRLMMLPYVAAIDHFQELVYERPNAGAPARRATWLELEQRYMPWRKHAGIPALQDGRTWQTQRHVYRFPFYYIDYAIATCCALQLWQESRVTYRRSVEQYLELCNLGGSLPFRQIIRAAGLRSPFERGTLAAVAQEAAAYLE
jgi:M3 family oligoendopeptidase